MKDNAKRNRRIRKKLRVDEFKELGFEVSWHFPQGTDDTKIDSVIDGLINEVIEVNGLGFAGGGDLEWEGIVCTQKKLVSVPMNNVVPLKPIWKVILLRMLK
jgi:hypothetical protein